MVAEVSATVPLFVERQITWECYQATPATHRKLADFKNPPAQLSNRMICAVVILWYRPSSAKSRFIQSVPSRATILSALQVCRMIE